MMVVIGPANSRHSFSCESLYQFDPDENYRGQGAHSQKFKKVKRSVLNTGCRKGTKVTTAFRVDWPSMRSTKPFPTSPTNNVHKIPARSRRFALVFKFEDQHSL